MRVMLTAKRSATVATIEEASAVVTADIAKRGIGGTAWGRAFGRGSSCDATVTDDNGQPIARVSYNGRVWPAAPWYSGQPYLYSPFGADKF